jgi:hypothetical protein
VHHRSAGSGKGRPACVSCLNQGNGWIRVNAGKETTQETLICRQMTISS